MIMDFDQSLMRGRSEELLREARMRHLEKRLRESRERRSARRPGFRVWSGSGTTNRPLTKMAGYIAAIIWIAIVAIQVYWTLGWTWTMRASLGESNPLPLSLVLWVSAAVKFAAVLIVLGRLYVWRERVPWWIFKG